MSRYLMSFLGLTALGLLAGCAGFGPSTTPPLSQTSPYTLVNAIENTPSMSDPVYVVNGANASSMYGTYQGGTSVPTVVAPDSGKGKNNNITPVSYDYAQAAYSSSEPTAYETGIVLPVMAPRMRMEPAYRVERPMFGGWVKGTGVWGRRVYSNPYAGVNPEAGNPYAGNTVTRSPRDFLMKNPPNIGP